MIGPPRLPSPDVLALNLGVFDVIANCSVLRRSSRSLVENPTDLVSQFRDFCRDDVPKRFVIKPKVRVGQDIAESGHSLPIHFWMSLANIGRYRLRSLSNNLKISENGVVRHFVRAKRLKILCIRVPQDPVGRLDNVLEEQPPTTRHEWPRARFPGGEMA